MRLLAVYSPCLVLGSRAVLVAVGVERLVVVGIAALTIALAFHVREQLRRPCKLVRHD